MFAALQKLGRSLMLPIAVLPAAGLLLRFGQPDLLNIPWLAAAGGAVFDNLPLLFAIGVAVGFTSDVGTAGLSGAVGYWVFTSVLVNFSQFLYGEEGADVSMGVLAGILMGVIAAALFQRYHTVRPPEWLAFFGGKRFVPIITAVVAVILGLIFGAIWRWPEAWLASVAEWAVGAGALGAAVFGFLNRLLIPLGLHHVINSVVWFQFGDLTNFFETAGQEGGLFMTGFFPVMMLGLPAAALAMYVTARRENRGAVGGILFSAALTSLITGVTEPLEFAFMFVSPILYVVHALLTALSSYVTIALGTRTGFTFSAGLIDYLLNYGIATRPLLLLLITGIFGVIYFFVFLGLIRALDIQTPGREPEYDETLEETIDEPGAQPRAGGDDVEMVETEGGVRVYEEEE